MLKNKLMRFRILLFILMMTCFMQVNAQRPIFMMSSIKSVNGLSINVSAINFKGVGACLDVRNGVVLRATDRGAPSVQIRTEEGVAGGAERKFEIERGISQGQKLGLRRERSHQFVTDGD